MDTIHPEVILVDSTKFNNLVKKFDYNSDCEAFVMQVENKNYIVINKDKYDLLDDDLKRILIVHECAHAIDNINDEELADYWTFDYLNEKQIKILKSMWKERHGRIFKDFVNTIKDRG